jgi:hypothetical protein
MCRKKGDIRRYATEEDRKEGIRLKAKRYYEKHKEKIKKKAIEKRQTESQTKSPTKVTGDGMKVVDEVEYLVLELKK